MPSEVILPRVDMDMTTGKIARWHVEAGATVTKGQPLFDIETDKAAMEIEAPASGTIRDMTGVSGDDIPVGSVVAWIFAEGETSVEAKAAPAPHASSAPRIDVPELRFDSAQPPARAQAPGADRETSTPPLANGFDGQPRATPMARRLARAHGVDLATLAGSGPRGRIQAADIEAAAAAPAAIQAPAPKPAPVIAPAPQPAPAPSTTAVASTRQAGPTNLVQLREGDGRPILLVHGFGADHNTWRPYLGHVASGRPVLAFDLPGHGGSPLGGVADFAALVDGVAAGLGQAGLGAVDLVGHSLGGAVAVTLAAIGVVDVRSLLLLAPAGLGPDIDGDFLDGYLRAGSEAALTPWLHRLVADPGVISSAFVRATLRARDGTTLVADQRAVAAAVFPDGTQAFSIRADLARLAMPVRVVVGTADRIIPSRHAADLPPMVALHRLAGIGHMPQFEAAGIVAAVHEQMTA